MKVVEEIAKACASSSLIVAVQELGMLPIVIGGSDEQKRRSCPSSRRGEHLAAYALTEVSSGSDALGSMRTRAEQRGDAYVLNGQKIWITNGSVADVVCVFAVTDPATGRERHQRVRRRERHARLQGRQAREKDGYSRLADRRAGLRRLRGPGGEPLGDEGEGFKIAMKVLDKSRPGIAAQALGIAAGALDYATNTRKERIAFGKPIGQQQGVGFMLADMKTEVESARFLLYEAARKCDEGAPDVTLWAAMASSNAATSR